MSQVTEQSVRFQTALASIKLIQASAVLDLTEDDFDFLTSNKVWIATDRSRARRCVRSEERRVGKECRCRRWWYNKKKLSDVNEIVRYSLWIKGVLILNCSLYIIHTLALQN